MTSAAIVQKLWNYCNVLRNEGMSYSENAGKKPAKEFRKEHKGAKKQKPPFWDGPLTPSTHGR